MRQSTPQGGSDFAGLKWTYRHGKPLPFRQKKIA
jgi:hypothetical protein